MLISQLVFLHTFLTGKKNTQNNAPFPFTKWVDFLWRVSALISVTSLEVWDFVGGGMGKVYITSLREVYCG